MKAKLMVVDDDHTHLRFLADFLGGQGYDTVTADRGTTALRKFYEFHPDLVIVDVMMPGMDGWELTARLREMADTPIILLTAKTSEADKLRGFRLGVDDYISKPFSLAELAARVRAVLSRTLSQQEIDDGQLQSGEIAIDLRKREAALNDKMLDLTPTEFRLLAALVRRAGEAVSRRELIDQVWGEYRMQGGSALRRYIWFLRQKIEPDPENPSRLLTVRGFGYRLEP